MTKGWLRKPSQQGKQMDQQQGSQPSSSKIERKTVEKNRRNQMKNLYSHLLSLLDNYDPKIPLPDKIDEAINYIKRQETKVKMAQEEKERLMKSKRRSSGCSSASEARGSLKPPKMKIHETGSSLEVILKCGVDDQFIFCELIRILHEDNVDVITVNSSMVGDSMLHVVRGEVPLSSFEFGGTKVSERLKWFANKFVSDVEMESELLWDFDIGTTETWGLLDPALHQGLPPNPL
ncbi:Transcription factor bHLH162, partial [Mucuna pruriens]